MRTCSGGKTLATLWQAESEIRQQAHTTWQPKPKPHGADVNALSPDIQKQLGDQLADEVIQSSKNIVSRIMDNVGSLIDIEGMSVTAARQDPTFMNRMFLDVGKQEFIFIERSGLYFGFLFGLGQMLT